MSNTIAINENEISTLIDNLTTSGEEVLKSLEEMSKVMSNLQNSIQGEVGDSINGKFSEYEEKFPYIKENLESYIQDFKNLVTSFKDEDNSVDAGEASKAVEGGELINVRNQV